MEAPQNVMVLLVGFSCRLHVSTVPKSLPCRENEFNAISNFVEGKLIAEESG